MPACTRLATCTFTCAMCRRKTNIYVCPRLSACAQLKAENCSSYAALSGRANRSRAERHGGAHFSCGRSQLMCSPVIVYYDDRNMRAQTAKCTRRARLTTRNRQCGMAVIARVMLRYVSGPVCECVWSVTIVSCRRAALRGASDAESFVGTIPCALSYFPFRHRDCRVCRAFEEYSGHLPVISRANDFVKCQPMIIQFKL